MKLGLRFWFGLLAITTSCAPAPEGRSDPPSRLAEDAGADAGAGAHADRVEVVHGVPARGRDPGVVAIEIAEQALCSGTLISPRLVLTARHCVSKTVEQVGCPPSGVQVTGERSAKSLAIRVGEDVASSRVVAHGLSTVTPSGVTLCDADIALVILDEPVTIVKPVPIRSRGPSRGEHVRAVGFGLTGDDGTAGKKLVREHVRVESVMPAEFTVGEATCNGDSGGPALDESTGEVVGVVSRGGPTCEGPDTHNIYTRVDTWAWLIEEAFTRVAEIDKKSGDADAGADDGLVRPPRGTKEKPPSDMGGACEKAADCGAGICVTDGDRQYCSRSCGSGDRCPTGYHCESVEPSGSACIAVN